MNRDSKPDIMDEDVRALREVTRDVPPVDPDSKSRWVAALDAEIAADRAPTPVVGYDRLGPFVPAVVLAALYAAPTGVMSFVLAVAAAGLYAVGANALHSRTERLASSGTA
ncbi:MAG: hypothetical protein AAF389_12155 [Gemmatimonadota bacterium]